MARSLNKAQRLQRILELLELKPHKALELANSLEAQKRTILRDLQELSLAYPIEKLEGDRYQIRQNATSLNPLEALAVHAAVRLLYHHSPTPNLHYRSALEKLAKMLPEPARSIAADSAHHLRSSKIARDGEERVLDFVAHAWFQQKVLRFQYQPLGKAQAEWRELETYLLEVSRDNLALYAIGLERNLQQIYTYKLSRMSRIRTLEEHYSIPESFDGKDYLRSAWGIMGGAGGKTVTVRLRFAPDAALRIREGGYPNLTLGKEDAEGWLHVSILAGADNQGFPIEILPWVQTWGPRVEVLEPVALRHRWLEQATALALQSPHLQNHIASLVDAARQENKPMRYLSEQAAALWAKTNSAKNEGYSLLGHLLDVAAVAKELLDREPESTQQLYAQDFGLANVEDAKTWVAALVGLHDIGKATPAFQQKWKIGRQLVKNQGLNFVGDKGAAHGQLSQKILQTELKSLCNFSHKLARQIADAVGAHHGFRSNNATIKGIPNSDLGEYRGDESQLWQKTRKELVQTFLKAVGVVRLPKPQCKQLSGEAFMRLAGLTSFADWIGSDTRFFPTARTVYNPHDFYDDALLAAVEALQTIGWEKRSSLLEHTQPFEDIFPFAPNPLQKKVATLAAAAEEPSLLVIEAPMGEGKTEAAFYAHALLQEKFQHRGMYIALPTQATGNAMFVRSSEFLHNFNEDIMPDLQLLHGANLLVDAYTDLKLKDIGEPDKEGGEVYARAWFSHKKRALLSENGVGTVDQALLSVLNIRHHFVRMWGLGNRTVIFDEVHAYQLYTSTLITRLVRWLHALGSSVIIMSATLPRKQRLELLAAFGAANEANENLEPDNSVPYPRISHVCDGEAREVTFDVSTRSQKTLQLEATALELEAIAEQLQNLVQEGGCAAVIVNTVQRAQMLYQHFSEGEGIPAGKKLVDGTEIYLFHARYPAAERQQREETILDRFGKKGTRPEKAILIATQVVEQSLDLDFDVMISDLAPIDLLLQRSGRMHRHPRANRPAKHQQPQLYVAGLTDSSVLPDLQNAVVYDSYTLYRTWLTLAERHTINLPADFEPLIEAVYGDVRQDDIPEGALEALQEAKEKYENEQEQHLQKANDECATVIRMPDSYAKQTNLPLNILAEDEEDPSLHKHYRPATRLGEPSITVIPLHRLEDKLFLTPAYRQEVFPCKKPPSQQAKEIYRHSVKLSRPAIVHTLINFQEEIKTCKKQNSDAISAPTTKGWQKNALLRYCYPLIFDDGVVTIGKTKVIFDAALGIVYQ